MEIGVRYCGGCNPRYDRVALVHQLAQRLPEHRFTVAEGGKDYAAVLMVCGCLSRCASLTGLTTPRERLIYVCQRDGLEGVEEALRALEAQDRFTASE